METLGFVLLAAFAILPAALVVRSPNLIHAALWLGVTLLATAGLYAMLGASLLAGVQVLLYIGGIITLMIFGVMITRRHEGLVVRADSVGGDRAFVVAAVLLGVLAYAIRTTEGLDVPLTGATAPSLATIQDIGRALLGEHVMAFEVVSLLLLAAIVGAIVIARKRDPHPSSAPAHHGPKAAVDEARS